MAVVVVDEHRGMLEVAAVHDQQPAETLGTDG